MVGVVLVVLGLAGLAVPYFTTQHKENVAKVGGLTLQTTQTDTHSIPPVVSGGVLVLGLVLAGAGAFRRA
jgi:hypothetical protein